MSCVDDALPFRVHGVRWCRSGKRLRNLVVQFEVDHSFKQQRPFTAYGTETTTKGYTLLNASVHIALLRRGKVLVHLYLNATNLGDVAYQSHLSRLKYAELNAATGRTGVFNMGRNFSLRLNVPFSL